MRRWESHGVQALINRTRPTVYLTLLTFAFWIVAFIPGTLYHGPAFKILTALLQVLLGCVAIEASTSIFFELILPEQRHVEIPSIFRDLTRIVLYICGALLALKFLLKFDITPLLTGSAIISVVIGLALQESLGNLFSGIFLHGSKPFHRGDWIIVGGREGAVEKVDWRSTAIRTTSGDYVIIPNSILAKEVITNFSAPTRLHARTLRIGVHYRHAPAQVKKILLDCALKTEKVYADPRPVARIQNFGESAVTYEVKFWITDFEHYNDIQAAVYEKVWYHFKREDVEIPYPYQIQVHERPDDHVVDEPDRVRMLKRVDFLAEFGDENLQYLATRLRLVTYATDEPVIRQGEPGKSLYIVRSGRVQIQARDHDGHLFFTKDLGKGDFFGEISLLTGEPRSATVLALEESELMRLDKEAFRKIFEDNPKADELISTVLARRQELNEEKAASRAGRESARLSEEAQSARTQMLRKIRDFFSY